MVPFFTVIFPFPLAFVWYCSYQQLLFQEGAHGPESDDGSDRENDQHTARGPTPSTSAHSASESGLGAARKVPNPLKRSATDYQDNRNGSASAASTPTGVIRRRRRQDDASGAEADINISMQQMMAAVKDALENRHIPVAAPARPFAAWLQEMGERILEMTPAVRHKSLPFINLQFSI